MADKINIDVGLLNAKDIDGLVKNLSKATTVTDTLIKKFAEWDSVLKRNTAQYAKFQALLSMPVGTAGKNLARGTPESFLNNSNTTGQIKDFEARMDQMFQRITNSFSRGLKNSFKAVENYNIQQLAKFRQEVPSSDRSSLAQQIQAQQIRVGQAFYSSTRGNRPNPGQTEEYTRENLALQALIAKEKELVALDVQRKNEARQVTAELNKQQKALEKQKADAIVAKTPRIVRPVDEASLFRVQAQLLVNYSLMNKVFQLFSFGTTYVKEYDRALHDLAAITKTTDTQMDDLSKTFIDVSQRTKFSAVEVAKAAVVMGQAGFSAAQIQKSIESVTLLATATGSDLKTSVDVVTSALTIFNLNADETSHVADVMTGALNLSKLTMDKLALGLQYSGNAAADAGVTFEELVSVLGAVSNAGIKSGSTIGTGIGKLITDLQAPTKKLRDELARVGLTLADVDIEAHGFVGVMDNLRDAGFGAENAYKAFDLRAAKAFSALARNIDTARSMKTELLLGGAAAAANAKQMESLANSSDKLRNTLGATILQMGEPLKKALTAMANATSFVLRNLNEIGVILPIIGASLSAVFGAAAIVKITQVTAAILGFNKVLVTSTVVTRTLAIQTNILAKAFTFLAYTPVGRIATAIALITGAVYAYTAANDELQRSNETGGKTFDELQASVDKQRGSYEETQQRIESLDGDMQRIISRSASLGEGSDELKDEVLGLQLRYTEFADVINNDVISSQDQLMKTLRDVQAELAKTGVATLDQIRKEAAYLDMLNLSRLRKQSIRDNNQKEYSFFSKYAPIYGGNAGPLANQEAGIAIDKASALPNNDQATIKELKEKQKQLGKALTAYLVQKGREQAEVAKFIQEGKDTGEKEKIVQDIQDRVNQIGLSLHNVDAEIKARLDKNVQALRGSETYLDKIKAIDVLGRQAAMAEQLWRGLGKDTPENEVAIADAKAQMDKTSKAFEEALLDLIGTKSDSFVDIISQETGLTSEETRTALKNDVDKIKADYEEKRSAFRNVSDDYSEKLRDAFDSLTEQAKLKIIQIQRQIKHAADGSSTRIAIIDANIAEIQDRKNGGLKGQFSDADVTNMEQKKRQLQIESLSQQISKYRELGGAVNSLVARQSELSSKAEKSYLSHVNELGELDKSKGGDIALKRYVEASRDYNDALEQQIELKNKNAEAEAQLNAMMGISTEKQLTLREAVNKTVQEHAEFISISNDFRLNIEANIVKVMDDSTSAFSDFVTNVASGTQSIAESFRGMAQSVIKSMLDIASKAVAAQAMSGLGSIFGSLFGSIAAPRPSASFVGPMPAIFQQGGMVKRYAAGGGAPARDSVMAMLDPREYVLRASAVQAIGKDNLDRINAMGNTRTSAPPMNPISPSSGEGGPVITNVYVVSPDAKPALTKNDVVAIISDDVSKGGQTIKLIKSVVAGRT